MQLMVIVKRLRDTEISMFNAWECDRFRVTLSCDKMRQKLFRKRSGNPSKCKRNGRKYSAYAS